jgi:elongation factor G
MPASKPQDIRNVVLLGHGGAGKTTLGEAMLHAKKITSRLGSVNEKTSALDFTDIEKDREHSVDPSLAHFDHAGKTINLIDAPGYPDFIGGAISSLSGADVAVVVISASAGIEVNTRRLFKTAQAESMPIALVVNKIDGENLDLPALMEQITESFGQSCKPMNLPAEGMKDVVDCFNNDSGQAAFGDVESANMEIKENIIEADEELMEAYLGGEDVAPEKLSAAFAAAMRQGAVIPILFTAAREMVGVEALLDAIAHYFPAPAGAGDVRPVRKGEQEEAEVVETAADADAEFVAQAFKISSDPFVGKLAWIRVLQGTMTPDTSYHLRDDRRTNKVGHLFKVLGKETKEVAKAVAGEIVALAKVEEIQAGDVLHASGDPMVRALPKFPTPMYSLAVEPKARGDEQKISDALHKLDEEDPTFIAQRDSQTGETVISGIGDLHLRIMLTKMSKRFDLEVETKPPKIPYRETILAKAEGHHRHKKQTGGAGQFGEVYLRVEPMQRGEGFEFVNDLYGESIPRQFLPAIEKGIHEVLSSGAVAGYPMQDIRVSVYDGKHHPVDSKEVAFKTAGRLAFVDGVKKAKPSLLEPLVDMEITVPADFMGDIASDLSGRRGRILGQEMLPGNMVTVKAQAPLAEVMQYNSQLRSVTGGQGSYTMEFSHYEPVPSNVQQQIMAQAQQAEQEE